jgi:hypothetical protein
VIHFTAQEVHPRVDHYITQSTTPHRHIYTTLQGTSMTRRALHSPLLGDEHVVLDEEEAQQTQRNEAFAEKSKTETDVDEVDEHDEDVGKVWGPSWIMSILFPLLIFLQFWIVMAADEHNATSTTLSWPNVCMTIGMFAVSNWLFQRACQDSKIQSCLLLLLPEFITILVLWLVMFEQAATMALLALNVGISLLSALVLVETSHSLFCTNDNQNDTIDNDEADEEEKEKVYILIV